MTENELKTSVSGSFFKFKPEIDLIIDEFRDLKVTVLAPDQGWLYIPQYLITPENMEFRPLPTERGMSATQIEDSFLDCVRKSDFLYVANFEGYIGLTVGMEIGFAMGCDIPIFCKEPIKIDKEESGDLWFKNIIKRIKVATPEEARDLFTKAREEGKV